MDIQDTEKDYLFRVEVKDGDDVYISSLLHQGLPTGTWQNILQVWRTTLFSIREADWDKL